MVPKQKIPFHPRAISYALITVPTIPNYSSLHSSIHVGNSSVLLPSSIQKQLLSTVARRQGKKKDLKPLMNDKLVAFLTRGSRPDSAEVRVVIDMGGDKRPEVTVLPLASAVELAKNMSFDLIEIDLKQNPPVLKATDYGKLVYNMKKKTRASQQNSGGKKHLATKEYKFKAGISEHDLERKVNNMKSYLLSGHPCKVTITARKMLVNQNANIAIQTLDRVQDLMSDCISEPGKLRQTNEKHLTVLFQPKKQ